MNLSSVCLYNNRDAAANLGARKPETSKTEDLHLTCLSFHERFFRLITLFLPWVFLVSMLININNITFGIVAHVCPNVQNEERKVSKIGRG